MESEPFDFILPTKSGEGKVADDFQGLTSAKLADLDIQLTSTLRCHYPELIVTAVPASNVNFLVFAAAGHATAELDTDADSVFRWRGFIPADPRQGFPPTLGEAVWYARYHYRWADEDFILYYVKIGYTAIQYVLKEPRDEETTLSHSSVTDALIMAVGIWMTPGEEYVYVYDRYWTRSKKLWEEVQKASWDNVVLDTKMKKDLTDISSSFFDSKDTYLDLDVPWKRGILLHGPPGNGKTISIKALMHTMYERKPIVPCLVVRAAPQTYDIRSVFVMARSLSPCMLILEDLETIVTNATRSYFFNELDGLEGNDGLLVIGTTNYLDKLDPGLTKRPSRFDRKYLFPLPELHERNLYCGYWRDKLKAKPAIEFPKKLCKAIAEITDGFSFAYMKEAFVASLLYMARNQSDTELSGISVSLKDELDQYLLWRVMKEQVKILREDMDESALTTFPTTRTSISCDDGRQSAACGDNRGEFTPPRVMRGETGHKPIFETEKELFPSLTPKIQRELPTLTRLFLPGNCGSSPDL